MSRDGGRTVAYGCLRSRGQRLARTLQCFAAGAVGAVVVTGRGEAIYGVAESGDGDAAGAVCGNFGVDFFIRASLQVVVQVGRCLFFVELGSLKLFSSEFFGSVGGEGVVSV